MELYKVILLILLLIFFVYSVFLVFVLSHILTFSKSMKKRLRALDIILSEKAFQLLSMMENYETLGVEFSSADKAALNQLRRLKFDKSNYDSVCANRAIVGDAEKRLSYIGLGNKTLLEDGINMNIKASLEDLDRNFRRCCVLYNSDLVAYNYWITIPGTRLFVLLFRFRKAKTLG